MKIKGHGMAGARFGRLVLVSCVVLAACEPGQKFDLFGTGESRAKSDGNVDVVSGGAAEQDVESPEIFQVADSGLWDGRPSLGGVWIAHPDVTEPERVLIRNEDNGKSIVGALFRRERENPGPRFQVSSDAATELGMLAGSPSSLSVVALRRVEVRVVAEPFDTLDTAIIAPVAVEPLAANEVPALVQSAPSEPLASIASIAASAIEAATESNPVASLPEPTAASGTALQATASVAPVARPSVEPLSALNKPFIQLGIFSVQSNAEDTSELLRSAGIIPTIKTYTQSSKPYWRVLVGPIGNTAERTQIIGQIKGLGFPDAYAVTN